LRSQRKEISGELLTLKTLNLVTETAGAMREKVNFIRELLKEYGADAKSHYYERLDELLQEIDQVQKPDFEQGKRDYVGMSGNTKIRITPVYDHFFLSRVYSGQLKLSWRFNKEGRIDLVDAMLFPQNEILHLIGVHNFTETKLDWEYKNVWYNPLSKRFDVLNPGFKDLSSIKQYESVLRFGHSMSKTLLVNLKEEDIRDSNVVKHGQKQLSEIVNDFTALYMLKKTGDIIPSVVGSNSNSLEIMYE